MNDKEVMRFRAGDELEVTIEESCADLAYELAGERIEKIDEVLEAYEEQGIDHLPSYEMLQERRGNLTVIRGRVSTAKQEAEDTE